MADLVVTRRIHRFHNTGKIAEMEDEIINEHRLTIRLDGEDFVQAVLSPSLLEEFVYGFLRTRGLIQGIKDVSSLEIADDTASVKRHSRYHGDLPKLSLLESTGSRNIDRERANLLAGKVSTSQLRVPAKVVIDGVQMLSQMPLYTRTGATHCAILFSLQGEPIVAAEDIGRHNAVDKAIGGGLMKGVAFDRCWLAVSGRLPADMVFKPIIVGIPLVASVSAATSDGIEVGERFGLTVVGFTRGGSLNCYTHQERVTGNEQ